MFELLDGRASAFQWDTGLYIDCTGLKENDEVHFCRPGIILAILPAKMGETLAAPVPDELLQTADTIVIFAYTETDTGGITRVEKHLGVTSRPKPPAYVYTPAEALRYKTLEQRLDKLEETGEYYIPGSETTANGLQLTFTPSQPYLPAIDPVRIEIPDDKAAAAHIADKNNPHNVTIEQIGAAPAGYGLGTIGLYATNLSLLKYTGVFSYTDTATDNPMPGYGGTVCVSASHGVVQQTVTIAGFHRGITATRTLCTATGETTFGEWEWINPPLLAGVEYRTTERLKGAPVYAYHMEFNVIGGNELYFTPPLLFTAGLVRMEGRFYSENETYVYAFPSNEISFRYTPNGYVICSNGVDITGFNGSVNFYYVK